MKSARRVAAIFFGWAAVVGTAQTPTGSAAVSTPAAPGGHEHKVVVELFTSQGCSSCPPADRLLTELGADSAARVVPLSFHVDFWNYIGWTDPFSRHDWTERQAAYAQGLRWRQVYTPQAVIDGAAELVGSDANRLRAAVAAAAARPAGEISLHLEPAASEVAVAADVEIPETLRGRKLDLMLAVFETDLVTPVGRGENGGRTLRNDYVVRSLRRAARLKAGGASRTKHAFTLPLDKGWKRSDLGVAAFLQDPESLEIRGAASQPLSKRSGS